MKKNKKKTEIKENPKRMKKIEKKKFEKNQLKK